MELQSFYGSTDLVGIFEPPIADSILRPIAVLVNRLLL